MSDLSLKIEVSLDKWAYEESVSNVIKETILDEIRVATKRVAKEVRAEVEKALLKKREALVKKALAAVDEELKKMEEPKK